MAQFYTDFSEYSVGSFPQSGDDWTADWDSGPWEIVQNSSLAGDQGLHINPGSDGRYAIYWKTGSDVEIAGKLDSNAPADERTIIRGGDTAFTPSGYFARPIPEGYNVFEYDTGSQQAIASGGRTGFDPGNPHWIRFRANGTSLKAKFWEDTESEPSAWDIEATDASLSSGWVGFSQWDTTAPTWDEVGVGTDGDTAPTSEPTQAPAAPTNLQLSEQ